MSLQTSRFVVNPPVVLAPMAGITNQAFRRLCREYGAGLYVSEMVTSRALIERSPETIRMVTPDPDEQIRSVQLYGVDPEVMSKAVEMLIRENRADHIDLNMGCPVPKVTKKGGGAALPWKQDLFKSILESAVNTANKVATELGVKPVPVTVKMRMGIDDDHLTYLEAGRAAANAGVAWVALHARTAEQMYSGKARWDAIKNLVEELKDLNVPVLGNGDIWSGADAVNMINQTGCNGVVVGRGCLGRPWLFADLVSALNGENTRVNPTLFEVRDVMLRHGQLLVEYFENEDRAMRDIRKHMAWYLKGFSVPREIRSSLGMVTSLAHMSELLSHLEDQPYPQAVGDAPRGRTSHGRAVTLPDGWLDDPDEFANITIDDAISGG